MDGILSSGLLKFFMFRSPGLFDPKKLNLGIFLLAIPIYGYIFFIVSSFRVPPLGWGLLGFLWRFGVLGLFGRTAHRGGIPNSFKGIFRVNPRGGKS
jgi:hypothetical protein